MLGYTLKKIWHSGIVIFSVITAVFLFQSYSILDPVDDFMSSSFGDRPVEKEAYEAAYLKEAKRQNKHLPRFYFSIVPSYFPDTLHRIIFQEQRTFTKEVLRYSKCEVCTAAFLLEKDNIRNSIAKDTTLSEESKSILHRIHREQNFNNLKHLFANLKVKTGTENLATVNALILAYEKLENKSETRIFPKFIWHDKQNQFHHYIASLLQGKIGLSKADGLPALQKIKKALKWTLSINLIVFIIAGGLGLFLGLWTVKHDKEKKEKVTSSIMFLMYTMPVFWTATLMVVFFTTERYGAWMDLFPSIGIKYWYSDKTIFEQLILNAKQLILPVICITIPSLAYMTRIMKSKFSEVLSSDFITALRAKGLDQKSLYNRHILKNGLIPYITILTGSIPGLFAGSLVIEIIFGIPGIGKLMYDSIFGSDWAVISGLVVMLSIVTVFAYLLADVLYSWVNPKISLT